LNTTLPLIIALILLSTKMHGQDEIWQFEKEKDGIAVYTRSEPGSDINALKMTGTIEAPSLSAFAALFEDITNLDSWAYSNYDSRLLEQIAPTEIIYYAKSDFPWPMSNRDFVLHNWYGQDSTSGAYYSISKTEADYLPKQKRLVRVNSFESRWTITPQGEGVFHVEYIVRSDPAGNIPAWLINLFIDVGPYKTIQAMRKEVKNERYANASVPYIRE
jgi:hypothetical protein